MRLNAVTLLLTLIQAITTQDSIEAPEVLVTMLTRQPRVMGAAPHWDARLEALFFVSIHEQTIHKSQPEGAEHSTAKLDGRVSFIIPVQNTTDQYVVGVERAILVIQWDGKDTDHVEVLRKVAEVDHDLPKNRINVGKADPRGRLFVGTVGHEDPPGTFKSNQGSLFRVEGSNITKLASKISISSGLAWDERESAMYFVDSVEAKIRRYDYNIDTGEISHMTYIFDLEKDDFPGLPYGITTDSEGNLWVAIFDYGRVLKVNPKNGDVLQDVPIPGLQATSATFGGKYFEELYVTTANMNATRVVVGTEQALSGNVFIVTGLVVWGYPNVNVHL